MIIINDIFNWNESPPFITEATGMTRTMMMKLTNALMCIDELQGDFSMRKTDGVVNSQLQPAKF